MEEISNIERRCEEYSQMDFPLEILKVHQYHPTTIPSSFLLLPPSNHPDTIHARDLVNYQITPLLGTPEIENLTGESSGCFEPTMLHICHSNTTTPMPRGITGSNDYQESIGASQKRGSLRGGKLGGRNKDHTLRVGYLRRRGNSREGGQERRGEEGRGGDKREGCWKRDYKEELERVNWEFKKKRNNTACIKAVFNNHQMIQVQYMRLLSRLISEEYKEEFVVLILIESQRREDTNLKYNKGGKVERRVEDKNRRIKKNGREISKDDLRLIRFLRVGGMKVLNQVGRVLKMVGGFPGSSIFVGQMTSPFDEIFGLLNIYMFWRRRWVLAGK
ncbi:hypothetical protein VP01_1828g2 [Puccinia sorghi]|uniref:Uncharacterized protein n=1 Tax=Puccinia sorghi TaxID=27349 RepID=A0A0L6VE01_9BASI|nr:hypothetical protein VP01_1828g2 [Puccinia sorghi]